MLPFIPPLVTISVQGQTISTFPDQGRTMAIVLTALELQEALAKGGADIKYLFDKEEVPLRIQGVFYHIGVTSVSKLARFAENITDLKAVLKSDFDLDATRSIQERVTAAGCCCAFANAAARADKQAEIEGDLDAKRVAKPLPASDFQAMRRTWESKWWALSERWVPARSYLEKRADELEQGDLRAEPLTEVICREEDNPDLMVPVWNSSGSLTVRKASCTAPEPANSEQLRYRITLMGTCIMFLAMRHSNRAHLQGLTPQLFNDYLEYLLGEFVWNLTAKSADGHTLGAPGWHQVLLYDLQIRKKAYSDMATTGSSLKDALGEAWRCPVTKERYFTTPLALSSSFGSSPASSKRPAEFQDELKSNRQRTGRGKGKGRGGGQSKGSGQGKGRGKKGKGKGGGCAPRTPDGRVVCFSYNNATGCTLPRCNFLHVCGICFANHPMYQCTGNNGRHSAETQGGGPGAN